MSKQTIGLVDVDRTRFPNLALMKISAFHKAQGDNVEWANPLLGDYNRVYQSKIFTFTQDFPYSFNCEVIKGGTGYSLQSNLPSHIEATDPDYSIYPTIDSRTAYGFLTRGCPNRCKWCVVPIKEGNIYPYRDVEEIAIDGRTNLILMDNNILAIDYGIEQIKKIIDKGYRVDFNQALDARLITTDVAQLIAQVKFSAPIRLGCDTPRQIVECEKAMKLINSYRKTPAKYLLYTIITNDFNESCARLTHFRNNKRVRIAAQPFRDFNNPHQIIPQWQKDLARWAMRREIYASCDFREYSPRKGFKCSEYFK